MLQQLQRRVQVFDATSGALECGFDVNAEPG
jgi:hypothetical protein